MEFKLRKATVWDLKQIVKLHYEVFFEAEPIHNRLYPRGITQDLLDRTFAHWRPDLENSDTQIWMKVVAEGHEIEAERFKIAAYARWWIDGQNDLNYEELERVTASEESGDSVEDDSSDVQEAWSLLNDADKLAHTLKKLHIKEEKFLFLAPLVTAKEYRNNGCGKMLLEWGCRYARDNDLQCYLMSLPNAKGFYLKHGFEIVTSCGVGIGAADGIDNAGEAKPLVNTLMRLT